MTTYRVNGITINTTYNEALNTWYASYAEGVNCIRKVRRLREGSYHFYNNVLAVIDYGGKNKDTDIISDASINFTSSCVVDATNREGCLLEV